MAAEVLGKSWNLSPQGVDVVTANNNIKDKSTILKNALDADLKEIGSPILNKEVGKHVLNQVVLQIQKIRNVSAPKANEASQHAPRMLKLVLTDGEGYIQAIETSPIPSINRDKTPPGTKILVNSAKICSGYLLLDADNCKLLGGKVPSLYEKWEVAKSVQHQTRQNASADGPPAWVNFGCKVQSNLKDTQFKSLDNKNKDISKDNAEFDLQRQGAIAEATSGAVKKVFGGGTKQNVIHSTNAPPQRRNNNEYHKSDGGAREDRRNRKGGRENNIDNDPEEKFQKPSERVSLFSFLEDKLPVSDVSHTQSLPNQYVKPQNNYNNYTKPNNSQPKSNYYNNNPRPQKYDNSRQYEPKHESPRQYEPRHENSKQYEPRHENTRHYEPRHENSRQYEPKHDNPRQYDPKPKSQPRGQQQRCEPSKYEQKKIEPKYQKSDHNKYDNKHESKKPTNESYSKTTSEPYNKEETPKYESTKNEPISHNNTSDQLGNNFAKMSINSQFASRSLRQHLNLGPQKKAEVESTTIWNWKIGDDCMAKYWEDGKDDIITVQSSKVEPTPSVSILPHGSENINDTSDADKSNKRPCMFCSADEKRKKKVVTSTSNKIKDSVRRAAESLGDEKVLNCLEMYDTLVYHPQCHSNFCSKFERSSKPQQKNRYHEVRETHAAAFQILSQYIEEEIIAHGRTVFLQDILTKYHALFLEVGDGAFSQEDLMHYKADALQAKILSKYGDQLSVDESSTNDSKKILHKHEIDLTSDLINWLHESATTPLDNSSEYKKVAYDLRGDIKSLPTRKLPSNLTVEDLISGECDIPESLLNFMGHLVRGPDYRRQNSDEDDIKVKSLCSDIIYVVTKGRVKPSKHLTLGLAMKSLTSSRKVVTILNKYGHSIGYTLAEELETELTFATYDEDYLIPAGIKAVSGASTHLAFDNYDRFVDTFTGKDTLHDTVGIIYQFPPSQKNTSHVATSQTAIQPTPSEYDNLQCNVPHKRRRFDQVPRDLQPYFKKPSNNLTLLPLNEMTKILSDCSNAKDIAVVKDIIWAISFSQIMTVPTWIGYNCQTVIDNSETQQIDYLPQINASPTSYSVVNETLVYATKVAEKCSQEQVVVTYDLAIAKMAKQIQNEESPKFDNVFINFGAFHTQMAMFKALGKYIDGSGIVDILVQCEVLANGSVNGFIDCKHFNRCKRIHPLLSVALQSLHFERFLSQYEINPEILIHDLTTSAAEPKKANERLNLTGSLGDLYQRYEAFRTETLTGAHGKTAQYYMQYVEFVGTFFRFSRSIRTSDFELHVDSIFELANLFFVFNQPNYARWSVKHFSDLIYLKLTNSTLLQEFRRGAFGIKRTKGTLARAPVDLTLEQTINADAANSLTGISHFTNSISARQRWALSHSMRTKIISHVMQEINIETRDDISHQLQTHRIEKDRKAVANIISTVMSNMNPFDPNIDAHELFNIATGRAVSSEVAQFLLNANEIGRRQKVQFIEDCETVPHRFDKPVKRNPIKNFASECAKTTQRSSDGSKQALIKMERDIFGRLLAIALEKKVDLEYCFSFLLAPVPPSLSQLTGEMNKTDKSVLAKVLKNNIAATKPPCASIEIIDGFYFLHLLGPSVPLSFGKIAELILKKICSTNASEVHLIFDRYISPSIKDSERTNRQEHDSPFSISGPQQTRPNDFYKLLKNYKFKQSIVKFLSVHWDSNAMASLIKNKKVFLTVENRCYSYYLVNNCMIKTEENEYLCQHEEADTRIIYHVSKCKENSKITVKASDTDVLVILLGNMHKLESKEIWLTHVTAKKGDLNCINCTELAGNLGPDLCRALPAFHVFTGCDYTACFYRKGKKRPFQIFKKEAKFQHVFQSLKSVADIFNNDKISLVQEYTCLLYGVKNCTSVDNARHKIFQKLYCKKSNSSDYFFKKVKGFDSTLIPPCWRSLKQKILRTIYVNNMWLNATNATCETLKAQECGWFINVEEKLMPLWYEGNPTPISVDDVLLATKIVEEDSQEDYAIYENSDDEDND